MEKAETAAHKVVAEWRDLAVSVELDTVLPAREVMVVEGAMVATGVRVGEEEAAPLLGSFNWG